MRPYLVGIFWALVAVVIETTITALIAWGVQSHRDDCTRKEQIVLSIAAHDPEDLKGALDLYAQNCP